MMCQGTIKTITFRFESQGKKCAMFGISKLALSFAGNRYQAL